MAVKRVPHLPEVEAFAAMAASLAPIHELHVCPMAVKRVLDLPEVEAFAEGLQPHRGSNVCVTLFGVKCTSRGA